MKGERTLQVWFLGPLFVLLMFVPTAGPAMAQGLFDSPDHYPVGLQPRDVASGDFDRENLLDLVVANGGSNTVSVLLNGGNGVFQPASPYSVGVSPLAVAVARMDSDDYPDVITSNSGSNSVSVLINNGDGTFASAINYPAGASPWGIIAVDLNHDDAPDVAVVNHDSDSFSVLLNNGDGTLSLSGTYSAGGAYIAPSWLTAGRFDDDDAPDIAVVKNYHNLYFDQGYVQIFMNDGEGNFSSVQTIELGRTATTPIAADFDGDEYIDLAVSGFVDYSYKLSVLLNDGTGTFEPPVAHYAGASGRAASGDLDCDEDLDVVISSQGVGSSSFSVLLNHGDATFADAFTVSVGSDPMGLTAGDFDFDWDLDVAVAIMGDNTVAVTMNTTDPPIADLPDQESPESPTGCRLYGNQPNPFSSMTTIRYSLPRTTTELNLTIVDVQGRVKRVLEIGQAERGVHKSVWDGLDDAGREVPAGVYLTRVETAEGVRTGRVVLTK